METATMLFLTVTYWLKIQYYKDSRRRILKISVQFLLMTISVIIFTVRDYLAPFSFNSVLFLLFLCYHRHNWFYHSKVTRVAMKRSLQIIWFTLPVFVSLLLSLLLFAIAMKLYTYGRLPLNADFTAGMWDNEDFYTFSFQNFFTIFVTLLYLQTINNCPDFTLLDHKKMGYLVIFYISCTVVNYLIFRPILLSLVNQAYKEIWLAELQLEDNQLLVKYFDCHTRQIDKMKRDHSKKNPRRENQESFLIK